MLQRIVVGHAVALSLMAVSVFAQIAPKVPIEFRGVALGSKVPMKLANEKATKPLPVIEGWRCLPDLETERFAERSRCRIRNLPIANFQVDASIYVDPDGTVQSFVVSIPTTNFDEFAATVLDKYGTPKAKRSTVQNAMGATFDQVQYEWIGENGDRMILSKRAGTLGASGWVATSKSEAERSQSKSKVRKSDI